MENSKVTLRQWAFRISEIWEQFERKVASTVRRLEIFHILDDIVTQNSVVELLEKGGLPNGVFIRRAELAFDVPTAYWELANIYNSHVRVCNLRDVEDTINSYVQYATGYTSIVEYDLNQRLTGGTMAYAAYEYNGDARRSFDRAIQDVIPVVRVLTAYLKLAHLDSTDEDETSLTTKTSPLQLNSNLSPKVQAKAGAAIIRLLRDANMFHPDVKLGQLRQGIAELTGYSASQYNKTIQGSGSLADNDEFTVDDLMQARRTIKSILGTLDSNLNDLGQRL